MPILHADDLRHWNDVFCLLEREGDLGFCELLILHPEVPDKGQILSKNLSLRMDKGKGSRTRWQG